MKIQGLVRSLWAGFQCDAPLPWRVLLGEAMGHQHSGGGAWFSPAALKKAGGK